MNDTIKLIKERKSVRVFTDEKIQDKIKDEIINAAYNAPTAGNMMLYSIIDVTDDSIKKTLAKTCDNQPFIEKAPLVLLFLADYRKWYKKFLLALDESGKDMVRKPLLGDLYLALNDAIIAAQNTVMAAQSLGIGSCYIGDIIENAQIHIDLFNLPKYTMPACLVVFGYPTKNQIDRKKPTRFPPKYVLFKNKYDQNMDTDFITNEEALKMYNRKYISDFMDEMNISTKKFIENFIDKDLSDLD